MWPGTLGARRRREDIGRIDERTCMHAMLSCYITTPHPNISSKLSTTAAIILSVTACAFPSSNATLSTTSVPFPLSFTCPAFSPNTFAASSISAGVKKRSAVPQMRRARICCGCCGAGWEWYGDKDEETSSRCASLRYPRRGKRGGVLNNDPAKESIYPGRGTSLAAVSAPCVRIWSSPASKYVSPRIAPCEKPANTIEESGRPTSWCNERMVRRIVSREE